MAFSVQRSLIGLGLIAATLVVYAPAARFDFISWDDPEYVTQNAHVREGLSVDGVIWAFTTGDRENWHPLVGLSHMLDCDLYGLDPGGHHLTNIVVHVLNALVLFGLLQAMTGAIWPSAWVAAAFALHPLNVQAVAWVSARKDVLSGLFGLLAVAAYAGYARRGGPGRYLLAAALLALGLMAKPMLVTLPLLFLLLDYWPLGRMRGAPADRAPATRRHAVQRPLGSLVIEKLPLLALSLASSIVTLAVQWGTWEQPSTFRPVPFDLRAANAVVSYVWYLAKAFWPTDLALFHPHPNLPGGMPWSAAQVIGSSAVLMAISAAALWAHRQRYLAMGWLWYLVALVPTIGLLQVSAEALAARYVYLPMIGVFIAAAWGAAGFASRFAHRHPALRVSVVAVAAAVLAACMLGTAREVRYWRDSVTLYERTLAVAPGSAIMRSNLGDVLAEGGRIDEAMQQYRLALAIDADHLPAHCNLANLLVRAQPTAAVGHYRRAVELAPQMPHMHINLADTLLVLGQPDEAIEHYERALAIDANHLDADRTRARLVYARRVRAARP